MASIIVVNGEQYWPKYLTGHEVHYRRLQTSKWLYHDNRLWVFDASGVVRADAVLWRLGAVKPDESHRSVLELIRFAGVPCVNPARTLLRGYDRLSMLAELREAGLTVSPDTIAIGENLLDKVDPPLPSVVKVGNFHGGYGKALAETETAWSDIKDLTFISNDYITLEKYIPYVRDIRCLAIGDRMWAMSRRGARWKANIETQEFQVIPVPEPLREQTQIAMNHLNADILGLDFLENENGEFILLESNDIPGLSGFPEDALEALARIVRERIEGI
ncbi:ribosomal protein S6 modification protein [Hahella chejuensis KCTC 2396]|uniref:Ribosomal protein S6 modification protein n=1 Tax=Hahella chejuensis (strain KCTC 2396) TaxID=349521 RepID=Q2SAD9_HAHCH|nr:hypothetical protein [Hahella chejuensis]ABC32385.1 ribosomal protein S6 modification protein [Hahella chejuensis KCTC 2396]